MPGTKNLANAQSTSAMVQGDYVLISQGGSVRKISLSDFQNAINADNAMLLREVAWGVVCKQGASSPAWEHVGNSTMKAEYLSMIGRILLTNTGKAAKLSATHSDVYADGTPLNEAVGHVMFWSPRLYYVVKEDQSGNPVIWWSLLPIGGHFIEESCFGAYMGSLANGALTSRSGVKPQGSKTITQFWNAAQQNGEHFGVMSYDHQRLMVMLNLMQFANPNCQSNIGYGVGGSTSKDLWATAANLLTGATKSLGDACGKIDIEVVKDDIVGDNCSRVSLFGIEDAWGWLWQMSQGIYCGNSGNDDQDGTEVYIYEGNRMPSASELATHPEGDFRSLTRPTSSGYVRTMALGQYFDIIPTNISGGGSTSYWCDYFYGNATGQLVLWGGDANYGTRAGLGSAAANRAFSGSTAAIGSRLAFFGHVDMMSGADLVASLA